LVPDQLTRQQGIVEPADLRDDVLIELGHIASLRGEAH
jgi:hypothetical protein